MRWKESEEGTHRAWGAAGLWGIHTPLSLKKKEERSVLADAKGSAIFAHCQNPRKEHEDRIGKEEAVGV